jgi:hypothetical protein
MKALPLALVLFSLSCATSHRRPSNPSSPTPGQGWLDLHPPMQLRVENAYYREGAPKHGLAAYLGTEVARYQVQPNGNLRLLSTQPMKDRPGDQPPVERLMPSSVRRYRYHRFYFAIVFKRNASARGSVLLGSNSTSELDRLAAQLLTEPDSVCSDQSTHCAVFPEDCSVAVEMNGQPVRLGPNPGERVPLN